MTGPNRTASCKKRHDMRMALRVADTARTMTEMRPIEGESGSKRTVSICVFDSGFGAEVKTGTGEAAGDDK